MRDEYQLSIRICVRKRREKHEYIYCIVTGVFHLLSYLSLQIVWFLLHAIVLYKTLIAYAPSENKQSSIH